MAGSGEAPANTQSRKVSTFYRRPPGIAWLVALVVIPLLLGAIGYGLAERSRPQATGPTGSVPTLTHSSTPGAARKPPPIPPISLAPLSINRKGNDITLSGDFPDDMAKSALLEAVKSSLGPGVNVIDKIRINPNITALDFSDAGTVFSAAASITDFKLDVNGDTITLSGTAATTDQGDAIEQAAEDAWPNLNIVDKIEIRGPIAPTGTPGPPPPSPGGACANLQQAVKTVLPTPITFPTNSFSLTPDVQQKLTQIADELKGCSGAKVTINGYSDDIGTDAVNIPISTNRANSVADFLTAKGVPRDHITANGLGAANPVASNDTPEGRAQNRRVEIVVS
ncbi:OmpA family protein [uncultured Mycobacterium sp.]|uniref:channel-forming protein ArfA/OmpATb n=1 Tax=uncultured Mycobacterium sp. TaxID=171292 RepID=UPI0035CB52EB